jgi:hypothetical protein
MAHGQTQLVDYRPTTRTQILDGGPENVIGRSEERLLVNIEGLSPALVEVDPLKRWPQAMDVQEQAEQAKPQGQA